MEASRGLRLLVFDRTCTGRPVGLSTAWSNGATLYRSLGRLDGARGVASWSEALAWLAAFRPGELVEEIQYWGHGRWGQVLVDREALSAESLAPGHALAAKLDAVRERLVPGGESLVWLRTCEAARRSQGTRT